MRLYERGCLTERCAQIRWQQHCSGVETTEKLLTQLHHDHSFTLFFVHRCQTKLRIHTYEINILSLVFQELLIPTAVHPSRQVGQHLAAVKMVCISAPSLCPAPTSGMKPSTPVRAAPVRTPSTTLSNKTHISSTAD